jgi:REP element-mobilizing transposase RayT
LNTLTPITTLGEAFFVSSSSDIFKVAEQLAEHIDAAIIEVNIDTNIVSLLPIQPSSCQDYQLILAENKAVFMCYFIREEVL